MLPTTFVLTTAIVINLITAAVWLKVYLDHQTRPIQLINVLQTTSSAFLGVSVAYILRELYPQMGNMILFVWFTLVVFTLITEYKFVTRRYEEVASYVSFHHKFRTWYENYLVMSYTPFTVGLLSLYLVGVSEALNTLAVILIWVIASVAVYKQFSFSP